MRLQSMECEGEENNKKKAKRKLLSTHAVKMKRNRLGEYKCKNAFSSIRFDMVKRGKFYAS